MDFIIILLNYIMTALILTIECTVLLPEKMQYRYKVLIFAGNILFTIFFTIFFPIYLSQFGTFFVLLYILIIVYFSQKHKILSCILSLLGYLLGVTINYILLNLCYIIFKITPDNMPMKNALIFTFVFTILYCLLSYNIGNFIRRKISSVLLYKNHLLLLGFLFIFICTTIFVFNFSISELLEYPPVLLIGNCILFLIYFSLTALVLYYIGKNIKKSAEEKQKIAEYKVLQDYTKKLEELYQQVRSFKHDYINILSTLDCYIDQRDFDGLHEYFHANILPTEEQFAKDTASLGRLGNIQVLELKSILYQKFMKASSLHLNLEIDIPEPIVSIKYIDPMELSRIIGIFLDNAVEAAAETEEKRIFCGLLEHNKELIICITNSCILENTPIEILYKEGFTTKETGQGIGLYNVKQILKKYPDILHFTTCQSNLFSQELHIPQDET